ncbi:ATP-binding protein [Rugosimonospora africana]|uniref:HTH cro/C1-type domain-containing protein n=1 Tax=Rugosimonospora africana TaxID=556532 RepID=A0A8J3R0I6_9ACTN|nr:helix-turn-helix domain-containing protein [Rugosimonospora africana]GIH20764.1 hypothetical protein Raf01_89360 [Rugosimonospora africana]
MTGSESPEAIVSDQDFAADLESLRRGAGLTLRALVKSSGVPRSTLSDALAGRRAPRLETVLAIVAACGADPHPWRRRWVELSRRQQPQDDGQSVAGRARASATPSQLPRDVAGFASREEELARISRGALTLIHGRPGVGKTALAVHWAHSVVRAHPDGQLFLSLRGHDPALDPLSPVEAIGALLGSLDVAWAPSTEDVDEGARLWRSVVARRRLLIVLDDAVSADQVRRLLPGAAGCTVIVTSRHYLADLVVHDGADGIVLDVLPADSSVALLGRVAGAARVEAEPEAAASIAADCGHLPLALRLAGAVLAGAPDRSLADLAAELTTGNRLVGLEGLARPSAVERAFELSYRVLPDAARFLFRRLGLHPGPDISAEVAALLSDLAPNAATGLLRMLAEAHLIEPVRSGRYRMHDLLHDYAARLVEASDVAPERDAARYRLFDWYVDRALGVAARLDRGRERLWVGDELHSSGEPTDEEAVRWLNAEHLNLLAVIEYDARHGTGRYAWTVVDLITGAQSRRRDVSGLIVATDAALAAAKRHGDRRAEGAMCLRRGWLRWRAGRGDGAAEDFTRAGELFRAAGIRRPEAAALRGLSTCHSDAGRLTEARRYAEAALAIYRAEGDRTGQGWTLNSLAVVAQRAADFTAFIAYLEESLALHQASGNRGYLALVLANLTEARLVLGAVEPAVDSAEQAVAIAREVDDGSSETIGLVNGSRALEQAGRFDEAHRWAAAGVARARELGYQFGEAVGLEALASTARRLGDLTAASTHRRLALRVVREVGDLVTEAEILLGAARDGYQAALDAPPPAEPVFRDAHEAAARALDAALAADAPHLQAEARGVRAACELGLGKIADAVAEARQAVEMHTVSGARLAEASARSVLAHALCRDDDAAGADREWRAARTILDELCVPGSAPVRRLADPVPGCFLPPFA